MMQDKALFTMEPARQLEAIAKMIDSPGWQLFSEFIDMQMQQAYTHMFDTRLNTEQIMHNRSTYMALQQMKSWPERQAKVLRSSIDAAKEQAEIK
jgi:hypothetical protein